MEAQQRLLEFESQLLDMRHLVRERDTRIKVLQDQLEATEHDRDAQVQHVLDNSGKESGVLKVKLRESEEKLKHVEQRLQGVQEKLQVG
jgi:hypothetical protein